MLNKSTAKKMCGIYRWGVLWQIMWGFQFFYKTIGVILCLRQSIIYYKIYKIHFQELKFGYKLYYSILKRVVPANSGKFPIIAIRVYSNKVLLI